MGESNETKEVVKKKTKWIIPAIIGVVLVAAIVVAVIVIISATASSRALKSQINLGNKYLADLDYENAILAYEEAIRINPKAAESYLGLADIYLALGAEKEKEKDYQEAMTYYKKALEVLERGKAGAEKKELIIAKLAEIQNRINTLSENENLGDEENQEQGKTRIVRGNMEDGTGVYEYEYNEQDQIIRISYYYNDGTSKDVMYSYMENGHIPRVDRYINGELNEYTIIDWEDDKMKLYSLYDAEDNLLMSEEFVYNEYDQWIRYPSFYIDYSFSHIAEAVEYWPNGRIKKVASYDENGKIIAYGYYNEEGQMTDSQGNPY